MSEQNQKPWEKNGEPFDEEKAWSLIQNLRAEKAELQTKVTEREELVQAVTKERDNLATAVDEHKATLQQVHDDLAAREAEYARLETLRTKENLLIEKGISRDFASYIPDGDEATMTSAVEKFASLRGEGAGSPPPNPAQAAEPAADPNAAASAFFEGMLNN